MDKASDAVTLLDVGDALAELGDDAHVVAAEPGALGGEEVAAGCGGSASIDAP